MLYGGLAMPDLPQGTDRESGAHVLKRLVRAIAPWYGGVIAIYVPAHTVYGWLSSSGLVKVQWQDLLYNVCAVCGVAALMGAPVGMFCAVLGLVIGDE